MQPSNLLFILSDQHNRDTLGCYGHPTIQTPNLDALSQRGVRFDAAYTNCPICVPARASLATGRYVHEIGYWDNAFPYDGRVRGWGHRLQSAGHRVDSIGKLHYRSVEDEDGFSERIVPLNVVDGVGDVMGAIRDDPPIRTGMRGGVTEAGPGTSSYSDYDIEIADHSIQWLRDRVAEPDPLPWMLFCSFVCPHPPFIAPPDLFELYPPEEIPLPIQNRPEEQPTHPALETLRKTMNYDRPFTDEEIRRVTAAYYGTCTHLDRQVGRVLEALEETGLSGSTRIIYTSDHGESMGRRGLWGKFTLYEESAAVPLIVAGPGVPVGGSTDDPVSLVDCHPTILEAVGVDPDEQDAGLPGRSLWSIADGEPLGRAALSEYHAVGTTTGSFMIRHGSHKYIHYVGQPPQLFDLAQDPLELTDLASDPASAAICQRMEGLLREMLDPEEVDRRARSDQSALVSAHGGREAVLSRGTFVNSPVPGEEPRFASGELSE
jgi:choline-sulfatase